VLRLGAPGCIVRQRPQGATCNTDPASAAIVGRIVRPVPRSLSDQSTIGQAVAAGERKKQG
jgi:hypothetical protein